MYLLQQNREKEFTTSAKGFHIRKINWERIKLFFVVLVDIDTRHVYEPPFFEKLLH